MEFGGENQLYTGAGRKLAKREMLLKNDGDVSRTVGLLQVVVVNTLAVPWQSWASQPVLYHPCSRGSTVRCREHQQVQGHPQVALQRFSSPQLQRDLPCSSVPAHLAREVGVPLMGIASTAGTPLPVELSVLL